MTRLCFLDIETTGLNPDIHEPWEVALIVEHNDLGAPAEYVWQLPVDLSVADPAALAVGRFYERRGTEITGDGGRNAASGDHPHLVVPADWMRRWGQRFAQLMEGGYLIGANPGFDADFLARLLRNLGLAPTWNYRLIDVGALGAGYLQALERAHIPPNGLTADHDTALALRDAGFAIPWESTNQIATFLGLDNDAYDRHTALGDAHWTRTMFHAVAG
jgi:DNA polymerase III epsilon subunit-like protein